MWKHLDLAVILYLLLKLKILENSCHCSCSLWIFFMKWSHFCFGSSLQRLILFRISVFTEWRHTLHFCAGQNSREWMLVPHAVFGADLQQEGAKVLFSFLKFYKKKKILVGHFFFKYMCIVTMCIGCVWILSSFVCCQRLPTIFNKCTFPFLVLDSLCSSLILFQMFWNICHQHCVSYFKYFTAQ